MFNNSGIINIGNNNKNIINKEINYNQLIYELKVLSNYTSEDLSKLLKASEEKDTNKLIKLLRGLKKDSIQLIKRLGLFTLEKLIEKYILK